jgi:hypothetical protein
MSELFSTIGRLIRDLIHPVQESQSDVSPPSEPVAPVVASGIHPGLTDQQLVVLLAVAASEVIGAPVRIGKFRPLTAKDWSWAAQGRMDLHTHRLK